MVMMMMMMIIIIIIIMIILTPPPPSNNQILIICFLTYFWKLGLYQITNNPFVLKHTRYKSKSLRMTSEKTDCKVIYFIILYFPKIMAKKIQP